MSCLKNLTDELLTLKSQLPAGGADRQSRNKCKDSQPQTNHPGGIPLVRKLCYAVGGVPNNMTNVAIGFSIQIFLLDVVQMDAFYVSLILFVSHAWDAVTDPLVGYLVSRSRWTPIGKFMPWVVVSMPLAVLSYLLLWFVPRGSMSQAFSVPWYLTASCLFETLMSCFHVPYLSLNMFLGGDERDRDSATAYRMSVEMMAMLVGSMIQGQVVAVYNTERQGACEQVNQSTELAQNIPTTPHTDTLQPTRKAFMTSALVMSGLFFLSCMVLFLGVKEQQAPLCTQEIVHISYLSSLKMLVGHVPYQRLVLGFLFVALSFQMSLGNFALFCSHAAGLGAQFQHLLLVLLIAATITVPLWQVLLVRVGKKTTLFIGLSLFIPAVVVIASVPSNLPVFMIMCVLMGCSLATMFLLPWSMLPDVVDDFAVRNPCCKELEPLFFSCYAFCSKLGGGLSAGISTMVLHFAGYDAGGCSHGDNVVIALIVLFGPVPIILLLVGLLFFFFYPINEERRLQNQSELARMKLEAVLPTYGGNDAQSRRRPSSQTSSLKSQPILKSSSVKSYTKTIHNYDRKHIKLKNPCVTFFVPTHCIHDGNLHSSLCESHPGYPSLGSGQDDQHNPKSKVTWV
ncbi:sodium-dependent lysophosphatidylcholine symporter 1-like [Osmerus eperlanus]|uniref:sodium-dependent lysophosphatidylcholine symporter 1-like n=1 Tax=Osmerus eperlanus TaxID=29151 RepID=UPI002E13A66A